MGVTLERTQNKFASIIEELHSEPFVLSQFAIWLDLRLAEYKAKGAISLECSGEHPDPCWLKGHKLPQTVNTRTAQREVLLIPPDVDVRLTQPQLPVPIPSDSESTICRTNVDFFSLESNTVSVKKELNELEKSDIFPVGFHANESVVQKTKRTDPESYMDTATCSSKSPCKMQKLDTSSVNDSDNVVNESLLSIIAGGLNEHLEEDANISDNSSGTIETDFSNDVRDKDVTCSTRQSGSTTCSSAGKSQTVCRSSSPPRERNQKSDSSMTGDGTQTEGGPTSVHVVVAGKSELALSAAERMRKYRERIKSDPSKFADYRRKENIRYQKRKQNKNIKSEREKQLQRCRWRIAKARQRRKMKRELLQTTPNMLPTSLDIHVPGSIERPHSSRSASGQKCVRHDRTKAHRTIAELHNEMKQEVQETVLQIKSICEEQ